MVTVSCKVVGSVCLNNDSHQFHIYTVLQKVGDEPQWPPLKCRQMLWYLFQGKETEQKRASRVSLWWALWTVPSSATFATFLVPPAVTSHMTAGDQGWDTSETCRHADMVQEGKDSAQCETYGYPHLELRKSRGRHRWGLQAGFWFLHQGSQRVPFLGWRGLCHIEVTTQPRCSWRMSGWHSHLKEMGIL